ncbi:MAG TPA: hypothetical protein VFM46_03630, partial [Pseudomonadales bacterium]|nr:hypothetical protein [Pseudomonadales bacterium]
MKKVSLTSALFSTGLCMVLPAHADTPDLKSQVDALSKQLNQVQQELKEVKSQNEALATQQENALSASKSKADNLRVTGYGEVVYSRPTNMSEYTKADLARAVFSLNYRYDDKTRFVSEFELEHAVTSAEDAGEFEAEQFYIDHEINNSVSVKGGLFLIPTGFLNTSHEPPRFFGVHRNFVETIIIPSTWREGGIAAHGTTANGLAWDVGLTTGMNIANWEINLEVPRFTTADDLEDAGPFQQTHQELANANAQHLANYLSLNYQALSGFVVGGSVFVNNMGKFQPDTPENTAALAELHSRYVAGDLDISALYAQGRISDTEEVNRLYPGASNLIPAKFYGGYLQAAYSVWKNGNSRLTPFARWENFNPAEQIDGAATDEKTSAIKVWT